MTSVNKTTSAALCPGCDTKIYFHRPPKLGDFVSCTECGDMVEVINLAPLTLDWSIDDDDDVWLDDDDDNDDEISDDDFD